MRTLCTQENIKTRNYTKARLAIVKIVVLYMIQLIQEFIFIKNIYRVFELGFLHPLCIFRRIIPKLD